ncbi:MAG: DUF4199 family protein [Bacteroidota bacterium]
MKEDILTGILLGVVISMGTQILTFLGLGLSNNFVLLTYVCVFIFILVAQRKHWHKTKDKIPFCKALLTVIVIIIISRYIFQTYMYIYVTFINTNWIQEVSEYWTQLLQESNTPQEAIGRQIQNFKRAYLPARMFTIEILRYGFSQIVLGFMASLYFIFRKPHHKNIHA